MKGDDELLKVGDVVQVAPTNKSPFAGCLIIVDEIRSWGIVGCAIVPGQQGLAYVRIADGEFQRIGPAHWLVKIETDEPDVKPS